MFRWTPQLYDALEGTVTSLDYRKPKPTTCHPQHYILYTMPSSHASYHGGRVSSLPMPKALSNTRDHDTSKTLQFSPSHQLAVPTCACTMQTSVCLLRVITLVLFILCVSHCTGTAHTVIFYVIINTREIFNVSLNTREELNCSHLLAKRCGGYYCSIFV